MTAHSPGCPAPFTSPVVEMLHGAGGRQTQRLIEDVFRTAFGGSKAGASVLVDGLRHDSAVLDVDLQDGGLSVTTDAYVVKPLFFPGGDIGTLAVTGTLNDLAMVGAEPRAITASFILEEGLSLDDLRRIANSMSQVAGQQDVKVVAGDTKVVERGQGDGVFITSTGIGIRQRSIDWQPSQIRPGDAIVVSGDVGRHGIAVLSAREQLGIEGLLDSDCHPLWPLVRRLLPFAGEIACLRDLTRGGLGTALIELAAESKTRFELDEGSVPVSEPVRAACELLGLDPLFVANEGRFVVIVRQARAQSVLAALRQEPVALKACVIGRVSPGEGDVVLNTRFRTQRTLDWGGAAQLPRIC